VSAAARHPRVVEMPISALRPWTENPRIVTPAALEQLKQALVADSALLWARPLIALPDGTVICGNQRLLAARELGWSAIPTITVDLDRDRARLWALRDNNQYGEWDEPALADLLAELAADGVDLALTGFQSGDLDRILAGLAADTDPDDAPPLPDAPESRPGEIYQLGSHRLLCGDARAPAALERLLDGERAELLWTDPPYGVDYVGKTKQKLRIANDRRDGLDHLLRDAFAVLDTALQPSARFYIASPGGLLGLTFRQAVVEVGWHLHQTLVWCKQTPTLAHSDYQPAHEDILYGWKPGPGRPGRGRHAGSRWYGGNNQPSVFHVPRAARNEAHPTIKPVALIEAMLKNSSKRGDIVLDAFAGSGSTLIACERLGRSCIPVELDPAYCDVIRHRYQEFVGDGR
jgi:DNA modification methylase